MQCCNLMQTQTHTQMLTLVWMDLYRSKRGAGIHAPNKPNFQILLPNIRFVPSGLSAPLKCWIRHYWRNPQKINKHHTNKRVCLIRDWLEIDELEKDPVICRSEIWSPLHTVTRPRALQERPARLKRHRNRGIYKIENNLVFFLVYCKYSHEVYSPTARGHGLS